MPRMSTVEKARQAARAGKAPTTQAGEFVRKEIEDVRKGKHGARSPKQAIAIGLSKARKAGVQLPPPPGQKKKKTAKKTARKQPNGRTSSKRAQATLKALRREPISTVTPEKLAEHTRQVAKKRGPAKRRQAALKAAQTRKKIRQQHHATMG